MKVMWSADQDLRATFSNFVISRHYLCINLPVICILQLLYTPNNYITVLKIKKTSVIIQIPSAHPSRGAPDTWLYPEPMSLP